MSLKVLTLELDREEHKTNDVKPGSENGDES